MKSSKFILALLGSTVISFAAFSQDTTKPVQPEKKPIRSRTQAFGFAVEATSRRLLLDVSGASREACGLFGGVELLPRQRCPCSPEKAAQQVGRERGQN